MSIQRGYSLFELLLVVLTMALLVAIIFANFRDATLVERRSLAQQALLTTAGLQERWFLRLYEYANRIEDVGGATAAGDHYKLRVTQDPCGNAKCFTVFAIAIGEQEKDKQCEVMSINNLGIRKAQNVKNEDTSSECWENRA